MNPPRLLSSPIKSRSLVVWAIAIAAFSVSMFGQNLKTATVATKQSIGQSYGRLPLSFEANQGQTDPRVRFLARGSGYSLLFTDTEAVISLPHLVAEGVAKTVLQLPVSQPAPSFEARTENLISANDRRQASEVVRIKLNGASSSVRATSEDSLPGTVNYFVGNERAKWMSNIPTFGRIRYSDVYPGIDLIYYGNHQQLEYDFIVAPGSDINRIQLTLEGAENLRLDRAGNLNIETGNGPVSFRRPVVCQSIDGERRLVKGAFRLSAKNKVSFDIGNYDHTKKLVIDPILSYSTYLATGSTITAIAVDAAGEAVVAGRAGGIAFPTTAGALQTTNPNADGYSLFVSKLNAAGNALLYSTFIGGASSSNTDNQVFALALDAASNAYIAGLTIAADFPVTPGAFQTTPRMDGNSAGFVAKLNSTGTALIYSTFLKGSASTNPTNGVQEAVNALAVDSSGNAFVTGTTYSTDFPITPGAFQTTIAPANIHGTGYVAELNSQGSALVYSTFLGGSDEDRCQGIAVDSDGNTYAVGNTDSKDFPLTAGAIGTANNATFGPTGFVTKINPSGTAQVYSTYLGGTFTDQASAVAVDSVGHAYVTGTASSRDFPVTPGAYQTSMNANASWNVFVSKFSVDGMSLDYSTYIGDREDQGIAIAIDSSDDAYIIGNSANGNFPTTPGAFQTIDYALYASADEGSVMAKVNPSGSKLLYSTYLSGSGDLSGYTCDCAYGLALDKLGNVYAAGGTVSSDFPVTPGTYLTELEPSNGVAPFGTYDVVASYITKFNASELRTLPLSTTTLSANSNPQTVLNNVTFTAQVKPAAGGALPTGLIGFDLDFYLWATTPLNATGKATFTPAINQMYVGPHHISAFYLGDQNNSPSNGTIVENVVPILTTTKVTASPNSVPYGTQVTLNASVAAIPSTPVPIGFVAFNAGNMVLGYANLDSSGHTSLTTTAIPVGTNTITATYNYQGDAFHQSSVGMAAETILALGVTPPPTFSPSAGTYTSTQQVSLADTNPTAIIFYTTDGSTPTLASTQFVLPIAVNSTQTINAIAIADGYSPSAQASALYTLNLPPPGFSMTLSPTALVVPSGSAETTTISVTPISGYTNNVTFACSGLPAQVTCSFSPATLATDGYHISQTTLTVTNGATSNNAKRHALPVLPISIAMLSLCWIGRGRRRPKAWLFPVVSLFAGTMLLIACGGAGNGSVTTAPPSNTATISVTATGGNATQTAYLKLIL